MFLLVGQHVVLVVELSMAHATLERHQIGVDDGMLAQVTLRGEALPANGADKVLLLGVGFLVLF